MEQEEEMLKEEEDEFLKEKEAIRLRKPLAAPPQTLSPPASPDASPDASPAPPPLPPKEENSEKEGIFKEEEYLAEKELPIIERLSLEHDYPNRTVDPSEIFSTEYRDRSNMQSSSQWFFDEFSGLYRPNTPSLYQSLPTFQTIDSPKQVNTSKTLSRSITTHTADSRSSFARKLKLSNIQAGTSVCSRTNTISSITEDWPTPTTVEQVHSLKKRVHSMRDRRKKLDLCRILMDTACQGETTVFITESPIPGTPPVNTRYSQQELRKKKKTGDLILDQVLVLEAQKILKKLAIGAVGHNTDGDAQFLLANCYGVGGLGLRVDRERAFSLYIHASKQNHIESTYRAAVCYEIGVGTKRDYNRAMVFYRKAANLSHVASMYKLGVILLRGFCGQAVNIREAITWLQRAAALASTQNPHALYVLALFQFMEEFSDNAALIADIPYALELLHEAAQLEYLPSQVKLGELYEVGGPVEVDDALSVYWYTRAAEQGNADAALALSSWYLTGSSGILPQSDREAYLWARKAASSQFADRWTIAKAYFLIGIYVYRGIGINQKSKEEAKIWFKKSAALGHKGAVEMIEGNHVAMLTVT
ncbi:MAG: SEL1-like repeat protein [Paenibacillus sp.]|nr:SEL1-like repeat protein [Paenibacillus sp.]